MLTSPTSRSGGCALALAAALFSVGCATTEKSKRLETQTVATRNIAYAGPKFRVALGKFENRSPYMNGIFSDGVDRLGLQAEQIMKTHLSQTGRFTVVDRVNLEEMQRESEFAGTPLKTTAGELIVTGAVTEFGRKEVGTAGSIFGKTRHQVAHAKIQLSVVDVRTSEVLFSEQGVGEYDLGSGDVLGFGSAAGERRDAQRQGAQPRRHRRRRQAHRRDGARRLGQDAIGATHHHLSYRGHHP
jgi:curli biogenesis system outer membrane secretion channel CsgG